MSDEEKNYKYGYLFHRFSESIKYQKTWTDIFKDWVFILLSFFVVTICILTIYGIYLLALDLVFEASGEPGKENFANIRNSLFILAALIGIPFFLWRTWIAQQQSHIADRQAETARDRAYTELFTKAIEQLGAEKPKKEDVFDKKGKRILDATGQAAMRETFVPNIEVRIGAIYALERIMKDSEKDAVAIIKTLSNFLRENMPNTELIKMTLKDKFEFNTTLDWLNYLQTYIGNQSVTKVDSFHYKVRAFVQEKSTIQRSDIITALDVLMINSQLYDGKYSENINLRNLPIQEYNLASLDFSKQNFSGALMQGVDLHNAVLNETILSGAQMQCANLTRAKMSGVKLNNAEMQGVNLQLSTLVGADFTQANLIGASFIEASLQNAKFKSCNLQVSNLSKTRMQGANLSFAELEGADLSFAEMQGADFSYSAMLYSNLRNSIMSGSNLSYANLQNANLTKAELQEVNLANTTLQKADLSSANLNKAFLEETNLEGANLQNIKIADVKITKAQKTAASVIWVDFTKASFNFEELQAQLPEMFGHKEHTSLPEGMAIPKHWSEADMDFRKGHEQYDREWEAFKKKMGVE